MNNFYSLLEISETASQAEIKSAFKRLAILYHPDKHLGDEQMAEKFKAINEAYQTLSNPYEKARYDITLTYGRNPTPTYENHYETGNQPPQAYRRPNSRKYTEPKIDWKENWIATAYAFGFTFIVASIVMTALFIRNFYNEKKYEEMLQSRRVIFEKAKNDYRIGMIEEALYAFNELTPYLKEEKEMANYSLELYQSIIDKAEKNYYNYQFEAAIYFYEIIERFSPRKPMQVKEHLAKAYQFTNQSDLAIKAFTELLVQGHRNMDYYMSIAEIYRDQLSDKEEARRYFISANEMAIKQYESIYGKAYPLVMSGKHLPPQHYILYTSLANIYLDLEMYEKAIKTTDWNIQIWPDSAENYLVAAKGHLALNQLAEACDNFRIASSLGYDGTVDITCLQ